MRSKQVLGVLYSSDCGVAIHAPVKRFSLEEATWRGNKSSCKKVCVSSLKEVRYNSNSRCHLPWVVTLRVSSRFACKNSLGIATTLVPQRVRPSGHSFIKHVRTPDG